jgi:hypothetical protein
MAHFVRPLYSKIRDLLRKYASDKPAWWDPNWYSWKANEIVPGVETIIFSKNRACQLDQLLRSLAEHLEEWNLFHITVIYVAENEDFREGYRIVQRQFQSAVFVEQRFDKTIQKQIQEIIDNSRQEFVCMLVDDDILIRKLSLYSPQFETFRKNVQVAALSIRLSPSITYCQPLAMSEKPPRLSAQGVFHWYKTPFWRLMRDVLTKLGQPGLGVGDWGVPMSMDGNFFRLPEFREYFRCLPEMKAFGDIEITMYFTPIPKEYGVCFDEAKLINIPLNSVRTDYAYPSMSVAAKYLNEAFIGGRRLDYLHLCSINAISCHLEMLPRWIGDGEIPS